MAESTKVYNSEGTTELTKSTSTYTPYIVEAGETVTIKTKIKEAYIDMYYVKGFVVNGETAAILDQPASGGNQRTTGHDETGLYEFKYTVPTDLEYIEVTPIYFYLTDGYYGANNEFITFYVKNYSGEVVSQWGNTLSVYAWYKRDTSSSPEADVKAFDSTQTGGFVWYKNSLGGYPGQPMLYDGTMYFMQVPKYLYSDLTNENSTKRMVQGVTLNNYYWDDVHKTLGGKDTSFKGVSNTRTGDNTNSQTYDYDDFSALAELGAEKIVFDFKYRNVSNNSTSDNRIANTGVYGNGWDAILDYYDRGCDLFGHLISNDTVAKSNEEDYTGTSKYNELSNSADLSKNSPYLTSDYIESLDNKMKLHIVSNGYETFNYIGDYATKWYVYSTSNGIDYTFEGALPPSAFIPPQEEGYYTNANGTLDSTKETQNKELFLKYFDNTSGQLTTSVKNEEWTTFKTLYNKFVGFPAVITYESAIVQSTRPGLRNDGRWAYSTAAIDAGMELTSNIEIMVKEATSHDYVIDTFNSKTKKGLTTTAAAYFTNTEPAGTSAKPVIRSTESYNEGKTFDYTADSYAVNGNRLFVFRGWYLKTDIGDTLITTSTSYSTPITHSYTFIAKYEEVTGSKMLIVNHNILTGSTGSGTTPVTVTVTSADGKETFFNETGDHTVAVPGAFLSDNSYNVKITLAKEPDDYSEVGDTYKDTDSEVAANKVTGFSNNSVTLTSTVGTLMGSDTTVTKNYYTKFTQRRFKVVYKFYDRLLEENQPDDIDEDPKSVEVNVPYTTTDTIAVIIANGLNTNISVASSGESSTVSNLANILDKYYIWATQASATEEIAKLPDFAADSTGATTYSNKYNSTNGNAAKLAYHFDALGKPIVDNSTAYEKADNKPENWVNYKIGDNYVSGATLDEDTITPAYKDSENHELTEVVVWAYNTPKFYNIKFIYPKDTDLESITDKTEKAQATTTFNAYKETVKSNMVVNSSLINNYSDVYTLNTSIIPDNDTSYTTTDRTFFNQRIGKAQGDPNLDDNGKRKTKKDENGDVICDVNGNVLYEKDLDSRDVPGRHIARYGIELGYTGTEVKAIKTLENAIEVSVEENGETTTVQKNLVFDGWYDMNTGAKITSDINYGYRVTSNLNLIAGYVVENNNSTDKTARPTVTANDFDMYFVASNDGTSITQRMRFNTQLNVYDCVDNDPSIVDTAAIYIQLRVEGPDGDFTTKEAYELVNNDPQFIPALRNHITSNLNRIGANTNSITLTNGKYTRYFFYDTGSGRVPVAYEIYYAYANGNPDDTYTNSLTLTSKNRTQFTMDITASKYNKNSEFSALLVFGALNLKDSNENTSWVLSDNCVQYINHKTTKTPEAASGNAYPETSSEVTTKMEFAPSSSALLQASGDANVEENLDEVTFSNDVVSDETVSSDTITE